VRRAVASELRLRVTDGRLTLPGSCGVAENKFGNRGRAFNNAPRIFERLGSGSRRSSPSMHPSGSRLSRTRSPRAPGTHRCPRKSLVPGRVQKCVTASQTLWFSQPETGTSAEQARGLGVLEKLHRGTGPGAVSNQTCGLVTSATPGSQPLTQLSCPTDVSVQTPRRRAARSNRPVPACGPVP